MNEHEGYEHTFYARGATGVFTMDPAGRWAEARDQDYACVLWVEDTLGNRYEIPLGRKYLKKLRTNKKHIALANQAQREHHS